MSVNFFLLSTINDLNTICKDPYEIIIDANKCNTIENFYKEFRETLDIESFFGNNLDAFFDAITDLEHLDKPCICFRIYNSNNFLIDDINYNIDNFFNTINEACRYTNISNDINYKVYFVLDDILHTKSILERNYINWKLLS